jgi:hypothetical protein
VRVVRRKLTLEDAIGPTPLLRLKLLQACDQWHSSRVSIMMVTPVDGTCSDGTPPTTPYTVHTANCVQTLKATATQVATLTLPQSSILPKHTEGNGHTGCNSNPNPNHGFRPNTLKTPGRCCSSPNPNPNHEPCHTPLNGLKVLAHLLANGCSSALTMNSATRC